MTDNVIEAPATADDGVDAEIAACLDLAKPRSFFLYAGAGSGKTRSLVEAIKRLRAECGRKLSLRGQRIGVVTYTNAACDEIRSRLQFDPLVEVSTIHAFAWSLIAGHHSDIRNWVRRRLQEDLTELKALQAKGRAGKASEDRARSIERKTRRLADIEIAKVFVYSPTGDNRERNAVNHAEVIAMTSDFLRSKPALQSVLVGSTPVLLIDESQDTNKNLMEALLYVEEVQKAHFSLGLFGDVMQRIYADGKVDLAEAVPPDWARPAKHLNHRCPKRVIKLINRIRAGADGQVQKAREGAPEGVVRLFIAPSGSDKAALEAIAVKRMADITGDDRWAAAERDYKTLILEHHMAAKRLGFEDMFAPLYELNRVRTVLLDGTLPGLRFFARDVLPLVEALKRQDAFGVAATIRERSPLLRREVLSGRRESQLEQLREAKVATDALGKLWEGGADPSFDDVLFEVHRTKLFDIPEPLLRIMERTNAPDEDTGDDEPVDAEIAAWGQMLQTPFKQIEPYAAYVGGVSPFATHQGVKGLEFPRVLAIADDADARGFMFSYDKLFGAKEQSVSDAKKSLAGEETSIGRTRRLFYVICSRAESSLAIMAYTEDPQSVRERVLSEGWFEVDEVEMLA